MPESSSPEAAGSSGTDGSSSMFVNLTGSLSPSNAQAALAKGGACTACRARKHKCDGTRPICHKCDSRGTLCVYDPRPKRRGADRHPGTRNRCPNGVRKSRPSPRKGEGRDDIVREIQRNSQDEYDSVPPEVILPEKECPAYEERIMKRPCETRNSAQNDHEFPAATISQALITPLEHISTTDIILITPEPSLNFQRQTWWDHLLSLYSDDRAVALRHVATDLTWLFRSSQMLKTLIHVPLFFRSISDQSSREKCQPAIVFAVLAFSTLLKLPKAKNPAEERRRAVDLQSLALSSFEASVQARFVTPALAQAGTVIALFELSPHPGHAENRKLSALHLLDSTIRALNLTTMDVDNPVSSVFPKEIAPILPTQEDAVNITKEPSCNCGSWYEELDWLGWPPWDENWDNMSINQELSRRVCWSALRVTSWYINSRTVLVEPNIQHPNDFFLAQASNYALLFPGEAPSAYHNFISCTQNGKELVWSLNCRTQLLFCSCASAYVKSMDNLAYASFASQTLWEADRIEAALNRHTCKAEQHSDWVGRHFLRDTRLSVACDLYDRQGPNSDKTLFYVATENYARELHTNYSKITATLGERSTSSDNQATPIILWWLLEMLKRCVRLCELNSSLTSILDLAQGIVPEVRFLLGLFPSDAPNTTFTQLQSRLRLAALKRQHV